LAGIGLKKSFPHSKKKENVKKNCARLGTRLFEKSSMTKARRENSKCVKLKKKEKKKFAK